MEEFNIGNAENKEELVIKPKEETIKKQEKKKQKKDAIFYISITLISIFLFFFAVDIIWSNSIEGNKIYSDNITINNPINVETPDVLLETPINNYNNYTIVNENYIELSDDLIDELSDDIIDGILEELNNS